MKPSISARNIPLSKFHRALKNLNLPGIEPRENQLKHTAIMSALSRTDTPPQEVSYFADVILYDDLRDFIVTTDDLTHAIKKLLLQKKTLRSLFQKWMLISATMVTKFLEY